MRSFRTVAVISLLALGAPSAAAIDTRIPSTSAGSGGTLAVRVVFPAVPRYSSGAPVAVVVPGGHEPGSVRTSQPFGAAGFATVTFLFPGGVDSVFHSDGIYDYRGPLCQLALRDVLRFACGALADTAGRTIQALSAVPVLTENVGVVGLSNGGSIDVVTLGLYAAELPGVRWLVNWESPTGPQTINADLGAGRLDCNPLVDGDGNGVPTDDAKNWAYAAYDTTVCVMDYTHLAWDPIYPVRYTDPAHRHTPITFPGALFHDGNGNGRYDIVPGSQPPCPDRDGNGRLDPYEDYLLSGLAAYGPVTPGDSLKVFHSPGMLAAARDRGLMSPWPVHIATPEQSAVYWGLRDATSRFAPLAAARPDFAALLLYRRGDHVQAEEDHAHIRQSYDGWLNHGLWCRLNPDASYYASFAAPPAGYVETPAGERVAGSDMKAHGEPNTVDLNTFTLAAVCEMADRVRCGLWDADLAAVIGDDCGTSSIAGPGSPAAASGTGGATGTSFRVEVLNRVSAEPVVHLRMSGLAAEDVVRLRLATVTGRVLASTTLHGEGNTLRERTWPLESAGGRRLPDGVYFIVAERGSRADDAARRLSSDRFILTR